MTVEQLDQELEAFQKRWCRFVHPKHRIEMLAHMAHIFDIRIDVSLVPKYTEVRSAVKKEHDNGP